VVGPQLSQIYQIETLPISMLVDGSTGKVLSYGQILRRAGLARHIETYLPRVVPATRPSP